MFEAISNLRTARCSLYVAMNAERRVHSLLEIFKLQIFLAYLSHNIGEKNCATT